MENLIAWIQTLKITQGDRAGMPFEVMPWQRRFLRGAFKPSVRHAALSVARANGKTTLCSGIAISAVLGPLRRARAECILVASSFTQARLGFEHAVGFLTAAQRKRLRILDNSNTALIECRETGRVCAASRLIRGGRTVWRLRWCWRTSPRNGDRAETDCLPRWRPARAKSRDPG